MVHSKQYFESSGFGVELTFPEIDGCNTAAEATRGKLTWKINGEEYWNFEWTWVEMLESLSQDFFGKSHSSFDLAECVQGAILPSILLTETGDSLYQIRTDRAVFSFPMMKVEDVLIALAGAIADRIREAGIDDHRSLIALQDWEDLGGCS